MIFFDKIENESNITFDKVEPIFIILINNFNADFCVEKEKSQWERSLPKESLLKISDNYFCFTLTHLILNLSLENKGPTNKHNKQTCVKLVTLMSSYMYERIKYLWSKENTSKSPYSFTLFS